MAPHYSPLDEYLCLEARGPAAAAFLHAQLSQTVEPLPPERAPLAGWLDARGRVRALLRVVRRADRWLMLTARDGAEQLLTRLRMFVLRSPVTLDVAANIRAAAVLGADPEWLDAHGLPRDAMPGSCLSRESLDWIFVGPGYWHVLGAPRDLDALASSLPSAPTTATALAEIGLGLPLVTTPLADRFVAQMLNLDALGALAFDKGCYPGQEIVARVRNLGDVKRRLHRYAAAGAAPPVEGTTITDRQGTSVGEVVRSTATTSGCELLAVVEHAAAAAPLTSSGAALVELPLPFAVPRDSLRSPA